AGWRAGAMKEFRCIIFTEHEVLTAVVERRRRAREKLPVGTILDVTYDAADKNAVNTNIRIVDDYGKVELVTVRTPEVAAALVEYCLNRKIPMPSGSKKWLELIGAELTLLMTFDAKSKKKAGAAPRPGAGALMRAR
ncbi:MAG: hypothetical protein WCJ64_18220, partial [Rhodospirillaceae bacterium]